MRNLDVQPAFAPAREKKTGPVLLVEDDVDIAEMLSLLLRMGGYDVIVAHDGQTALDDLSEGLHPCVILLDLMMPGMSGWEFRQRQMASDQAFPVVILSGIADIAQAAREIGAAGYLQKPIDLDELNAVLKRVCPVRDDQDRN